MFRLLTDPPIRTSISTHTHSYGNLYHTFLVLFAALNSNLDYNPFNASRFRVLASLVYMLACVFNTIILLYVVRGPNGRGQHEHG